MITRLLTSGAAASRWFLAVGIFGLALNTQAQQATLGDVLDKGGQKLAADEVRTLLTGATIDFDTPQGGHYTLEPKPGDVLHGRYRTTMGGYGSGAGNWNVAEDGKTCMAFKFSIARRSEEYNRCFYWFKVEESYRVSPSESGRSAPAFAYAVKR